MAPWSYIAIVQINNPIDFSWKFLILQVSNKNRFQNYIVIRILCIVSSLSINDTELWGSFAWVNLSSLCNRLTLWIINWCKRFLSSQNIVHKSRLAYSCISNHKVCWNCWFRWCTGFDFFHLKAIIFIYYCYSIRFYLFSIYWL